MNPQSRGSGQDLYSFREFTLDVVDRRLTRGTCPVHLAPKTYDVLVVLIRRAGRLVTKHEQLESIWPSVFVGEGILTVHLAALRKASGDQEASAGLHRDCLAIWLSVHRRGHPRLDVIQCNDKPSGWLDREVQP